MSEKFELIDAKDLPITEEEDVTVLCVGADGEMLRRDAGSFGMKASDLAELPTTEAEEVDVICVDAEGNLCRKSGASFGGGAEWDAVISITYSQEPSAELTSGSYDAIREKVLTGDVPNIKIAYINLSDGYRSVTKSVDIEWEYDAEQESNFWIYTQFGGNSWSMAIRPDNTVFFD